MSIDDRLRAGLTRNGDAVPVAVEPDLASVLRRHHVGVRRRLAGAAVAAAAVLAVAPWALETTDSEPAPADRGADLVGTYDVVVPAGTGGAVAGRWQVTLGEDGTVDLRPPPGYGAAISDALTYAVDDGVLTSNVFLEAPGCQKPGALVGEYAWERSGSSVRFVRIRDTCAPRQALFAARWEVQR